MGNELGPRHPLWLVETGDAFKHPIMTKSVVLYYSKDQTQYVGLDKPLNNPELLGKKAQFEARIKGLPKSVLPVGLKNVVGKPPVLRVLMGSMNVKDYCLVMRQKGLTHLSQQHVQELLDFLLATGKSLEALWESAPDLNLSEIFVMTDGFRILSPFANGAYPRETSDSYEWHQKQMMSRIFTEEDKLKLDLAQKTFYMQVRQTMQKIGVSVLCASLLKVDDDIFLEGLENKFDESHKLVEKYLKTFNENYSATLSAQIKNLIFPSNASVISFEHLTIPSRVAYTWQIMNPTTYQDNFVRKMVSKGGYFDSNYSDISVNRATYQDVLQIQSIRQSQTILATSEQDKREQRQNPLVTESALKELPHHSDRDQQPATAPSQNPKPPAASQPRPEPPRTEPLTNGAQSQSQSADPRKPAAGTVPLPNTQQTGPQQKNQPSVQQQQQQAAQKPAADPRLPAEMLPYGKLEQLMRLDRRSVAVTDPNLSASFQPQLNLTDPNPSIRFPVLSTNDPAVADAARVPVNPGPKKHEWTLEEQRKLHDARLRDRGRPEAFTPDLMRIRSVRAQMQQQNAAPRAQVPGQPYTVPDSRHADQGRIGNLPGNLAGPQGLNNLAQKPDSGIADRLSSPINGWKIGENTNRISQPQTEHSNIQNGPKGQNNLVSLEEYMRMQAANAQTKKPESPQGFLSTPDTNNHQNFGPHNTTPNTQIPATGPLARQPPFQGIEFTRKVPLDPYSISGTRPLNIGSGVNSDYRQPAPPVLNPSGYQSTHQPQTPNLGPHQQQNAYPQPPLPDRWTAAPPIVDYSNTSAKNNSATGGNQFAYSPGYPAPPIVDHSNTSAKNNPTTGNNQFAYAPGHPAGIPLDTPETQLLLLMRKMQLEAQARNKPRDVPEYEAVVANELRPFRSSLGKVERV